LNRHSAFLLVATACGGVASTSDGGGPIDGGMSNDVADAGWTQCTSPDDIAVCNGPNDCQPATPEECECGNMDDPDNLGFCWGSGFHVPTAGKPCDPGAYGSICLYETPYPGVSGYAEADYNLGVLFAQNGGSARVRYADLSLWTGDPIPDPATCPDLGPNVQPCGGSCGTCPQDQVCFGGSPLHPVGYCAPANYQDCSLTDVPHCTSTGQSCFTFTVQSEAQADADKVGTCFPSADCNTLAANLPGGGKCTPSP